MDRKLQRHRADSLRQHGFLVYITLQKRKKSRFGILKNLENVFSNNGVYMSTQSDIIYNIDITELCSAGRSASY